MIDKNKTLEFLLWLRKNRGWIFDSLGYSEEQFEKHIKNYLEEYEQETNQ
jgi:hypothetical protein